MAIDTGKLAKEQIEKLTKMLYNQRARPTPPGGLL
jgi:hypothetical protein